MRTCYVCILTNQSRARYIGMTNDLEHRVQQHKQKHVPGFTARYNIGQLVYYEDFSKPSDAIDREKQLKGWTRTRKIALIKSDNPDWNDLSADC